MLQVGLKTIKKVYQIGYFLINLHDFELYICLYASNLSNRSDRSLVVSVSINFFD